MGPHALKESLSSSSSMTPGHRLSNASETAMDPQAQAQSTCWGVVLAFFTIFPGQGLESEGIPVFVKGLGPY